MSKIKLTCNKKDILEQINSSLEKALNEIGVTETANVQANTPVDTGALKKSIGYEVNKKSVSIGVDGSFVNPYSKAKVGDYATKVEYEDKSYIRDTLKVDSEDIQAIINKHLGGM